MDRRSSRGQALGETIGVDYVEDSPEHAQAAAMFALKRKSGHAECSPRCSDFEMRTHMQRLKSLEQRIERSDTRDVSFDSPDVSDLVQ